MPTLRIAHIGSQVETTWEDDGMRVTDARPFAFTLSPQDAEDIRWYLESYRVYPVDPMPKIAKRIEQRMNDVGRELFRLVLAGGPPWECSRGQLSETRIEVETELADALVPWELLRDPVADLPLALHVSAFVRCHSKPALRPNPPGQSNGKIRILLAICRPREGDDVPFRSVARHLIRELSAEAREPFDLEVLRPPTFEQLAKRLRAAKAQGEPFHAVHFDGHGLSGEIFFENARLHGNSQPVKADRLGKLLHETRVPLLILNACRSADSEPLEQPALAADPHEQIRQFGSFAHAVMDCGASGVVAWRYSVFVDTAAQFIAELYAGLSSGLSLGVAATLARKQLQSSARDIEDWTVPLVFEAGVVRIFPKAEKKLVLKLQTHDHSESALPQAPDIGFIGHDETILKLDRTFDEQNVVVLHGYAGSGKTCTAVEFARWYLETGGIGGPVLFTSFERHKTLPQVLDELSRALDAFLAENGIQWLAIDDAERRNIALQALRQIPVLWIWDNVEPIAGFPAATPSIWSDAEQNELADFLREARTTRTKFLLTSRRNERDWLHDLPARIPLPPMRFEDCVQMADALASKHLHRLEDVDDWRPLFRFAQGNPMTLTVLVRQCLRNGLKTRDEISTLLQTVEIGQTPFDDDASEGRTRSLAASLTYGFQSGFTDNERKQLALLHLYQECVNVVFFCSMGNAESPWFLPELGTLDVKAASALFDKAAEIGLLAPLGRGYWRIHPALPWFFRFAFDRYYSGMRTAAIRAFVMAVSGLALISSVEYSRGNVVSLTVLVLDEPNFLCACRLAQSNGWWDEMINAARGLWALYHHTGRHSEWSRLVTEMTPDFVDPISDGPLPSREPGWNFIIQSRARLARRAGKWEDAERLQRLSVDWQRQQASPALAKTRASLSDKEKENIGGLANSLELLCHILRERGSASCIAGYNEAFSLAESMGDSREAAICATNLGTSYLRLSEIRDLTLAEQWYRRSLQLRGEGDRMGRTQCLAGLGSVMYERHVEAMNAQRPQEAFGYLSKAREYSEEALAQSSANSFHDQAAIHSQLGSIYGDVGQTDVALRHFQQTIRYLEAVKDRRLAGRARFAAARSLCFGRHFAEASDWAQAAIRDFEACRDAEGVVGMLKFLEGIESLRRAYPPQS